MYPARRRGRRCSQLSRRPPAGERGEAPRACSRKGGSGPSKPSYPDFRQPWFEKSKWPKVERKRQGWKEPKCAQTQTLHVFMERKSPSLKPGTTRVSQASGPPRIQIVRETAYNRRKPDSKPPEQASRTTTHTFIDPQAELPRLMLRRASRIKAGEAGPTPLRNPGYRRILRDLGRAPDTPRARS